MMKTKTRLILVLSIALIAAIRNQHHCHAKEENEEEATIHPADEEDHPDPNEEHYEGMIYVGRLHEDGMTFIFDIFIGIKYIFGTGFDDSHKEIEEKDLHHDHFGPDIHHDIADRAHGLKTEIIEKLHRKVNPDGPKPFGWVDTHPLDGGVVPPKVVHVEPFFLDSTLVTVSTTTVDSQY